jgi:hypothetical protein
MGTLSAVVLATSATTVLGACLAGSVSALPARKSAAPAAVVDCLGKPQIRPGTFTLACADGNSFLTGLSWTSWTAGHATATGIQKENDCRPDCAAGQFRAYPVHIELRGSATVHGQQRYTTITVTYPGARAEMYNGHRLVRLPAVITSALPGQASPPVAAD